LTRFAAMLATATLTIAVLFRSPVEYRLVVCVIVSLATIPLAARSLLSRKPVWVLPFLIVLGLFTPFQINKFSHAFVSVVDMAALVLFAATPIIFRRSLLTITPHKRS